MVLYDARQVSLQRLPACLSFGAFRSAKKNLQNVLFLTAWCQELRALRTLHGAWLGTGAHHFPVDNLDVNKVAQVEEVGW